MLESIERYRHVIFLYVLLLELLKKSFFMLRYITSAKLNICLMPNVTLKVRN